MGLPAQEASEEMAGAAEEEAAEEESLEAGELKIDTKEIKPLFTDV